MNIIDGLKDNKYGNFSLSRGRENFYLELKGDWLTLKKYCNGELEYDIDVSCLGDIDDINIYDLIFIVTSDWEVVE